MLLMHLSLILYKIQDTLETLAFYGNAVVASVSIATNSILLPVSIVSFFLHIVVIYGLYVSPVIPSS